MNIAVSVSPDSQSHGFANVEIAAEDGTSTSLTVGADGLVGVTPPSAPVIDLMLLASVIYAVDTLIPRTTAPDGWTRSLNVTVPVQQTKGFQLIATRLADCVSFLTGDEWHFTFARLGVDLVRQGARRSSVVPLEANTVCLFSGGLDSLVGAINWLSGGGDGRVALVGHHDKAGRSQADQKRLVDLLACHGPRYADRLTAFHIGVWQSEPAADINYRSRSFLFLAIGLYIASSLGDTTPVLIPENAAIAANVPLTPSRRGSCSTRTAHPFFLEQYREVISGLGLGNPIINPFECKTKGEILCDCVDRSMLELTYPSSVSCAKTGRRMHWVRKGASHCGHCMPCIYRRAALHKAGLDQDSYGLDILRNEIDLDGNKKSGCDYRALFSFLKRDYGRDRVASLLSQSGSFGKADILAHADVILRAMDEIRTWLREEAPREVRRRAGL